MIKAILSLLFVLLMLAFDIYAILINAGEQEEERREHLLWLEEQKKQEKEQLREEILRELDMK